MADGVGDCPIVVDEVVACPPVSVCASASCCERALGGEVIAVSVQGVGAGAGLGEGSAGSEPPLMFRSQLPLCSFLFSGGRM